MDNQSVSLNLEVHLADFVSFLKSARYGAKLGKRNINQERVEFQYTGTNLAITVVGATYTIPANGSWEGKVIIALPFIRGLRKVPPSQDPLTISYSASKLRIGNTIFPAKWTP